ncbi:P-loop containing nucleoside triphosphate hydrolase protein, partial [Scleroderma citrinum]
MPDKMIVVMGPTGVGKSSFIRNALPEGVSADIQVGHHIHSETSQVQTICWATQYGIGLNLVDTPGFDDSRERVTDADILAMIATFLAIQCREGTSELIGLVYLHRISDTRVGGTSKRNLRMFQKLCGQDSLKNVVIVTTMWDKVMLEEGLQREQELISSDNLFKPLLNGGAVMVRHDRTQQSARNVIRHLFKMKGTTIQIVRELVIDNKSLVDTEAGMELQSEVRKVLQKHQKDLQILEDELRKAKQQHKVEAAAEKRKVEQDIAKLHGQLKKLGESTGTEYISSSLLTSTGGHLRSDSTDAPTRGSNFHPPLPKRHDGNYIRTDACARSEVKCILNCLEILSLVKRAQSKATSTDIGVMESIICRAIDFAMAVVCGLERVQRGCLEAQSILTSRNALDLHKFSGELQQALTKAHERLLRAQQGMNG